MSKKILVTGGAGFIGSNLCATLIDKRFTITCLDNFSTSSERNIQDLIKNENFILKKGDVCDTNLIDSLNNEKFDEIYHLASPASVTYITDHPIEAALANSLGTKNLLNLAYLQKSKFLFASSSEAYGDPKTHPQEESYWGNVNSVGVRSGYDEGKRFGEALCMAYHREKGVDTKIVRIFNTYGPNSSPNDSRVIPQFVVEALKGEDITVHGDGTHTRSFCYVADMVEGLIKMMASEETGPINLGNPKELTILEVAKFILKMTNSSSKITFVQRPPDDPSRRKPDISLALKKLGWEPRVELEEGIAKTIDYFKKTLAI